MVDNLSPDSSPSSPGGFGGKRVNNVPIFIFLGLVAAFCLIVVLVGIDRSKPKDTVETVNKTSDSINMAIEIAGAERGGFIPPPASEVIKVQPEPIVIDENGTTQPIPLGGKHQPQMVDKYADERKRIESQKYKILDDAIRSSPTLASSKRFQKDTISAFPSRNGNGTTRDDLRAKIENTLRLADNVQAGDVTRAYKARMAALKAGGFVGSANAATINTSESFEERLIEPAGWRLNNSIQEPESPYTLRAGFVIPGIMIGGINSELPGRISGQISQNVYDTATGLHLLLPQGTRVDGSYLSETAYGQSRLLIAWNRFVFPDGKTLDIGSMPGADSGGYAGFSDKVDNHYLRIFGGAILMSGITASIAYATDDNSYESERAFSDSLQESLATNLGEVTVQLIQKNMNIAPTLMIRPGYRFNITIVKDMVFNKPFELFDY